MFFFVELSLNKNFFLKNKWSKEISISLLLLYKIYETITGIKYAYGLKDLSEIGKYHACEKCHGASLETRKCTARQYLKSSSEEYVTCNRSFSERTLFRFYHYSNLNTVNRCFQLEQRTIAESASRMTYFRTNVCRIV